MALSDILAKIEKETAERIAQMEKELKEKKEKLEKENNEKQKTIDEEMHQKVEEKGNKIIEKAEHLAEREEKNTILEAKREVIDEALDEAVTELSKADNYKELLIEMLKKTDFAEEGTVVVPAKGKEEATKKAIKDSGKNYFLSDKSAAISGGFIIKTDKVEIDNSFETLVKGQLREDLEIKLHKLLFQ